MFDVDMVDSRPVVNMLSAAGRDEPHTLFATWTANQKEHFGLKEIKQWSDSDELLNEICHHHSVNTYAERDELKRSLDQSLAVILLQNWMETTEIFMSYIAKSKEYPLGKVKRIWYRHEYQDAAGNLSHIHSLITLDRSEGDEIIKDKIRGSLDDVIRTDEVNDLISEGILSDENDLFDVRELARRLLKHTCSDHCK